MSSAHFKKSHKQHTLIRHLTQRLATKWDHPFSRVTIYLLVCLSIASTRVSRRALRGSRISVRHMSYMLQTFEDGAGMSIVI